MEPRGHVGDPLVERADHFLAGFRHRFGDVHHPRAERFVELLRAAVRGTPPRRALAGFQSIQFKAPGGANWISAPSRNPMMNRNIDQLASTSRPTNPEILTIGMHRDSWAKILNRDLLATKRPYFAAIIFLLAFDSSSGGASHVETTAIRLAGRGSDHRLGPGSSNSRVPPESRSHQLEACRRTNSRRSLA